MGMNFDSAELLADGKLRLYKHTGEESGYVIFVEQNSKVQLWSIPMYGGEECFEDDFETIEEAVAEARRWT
jgi:hypothetical protein